MFANNRQFVRTSIVAAALIAGFVPPAAAQTTYTWNAAAPATGGSASPWFTVGNWTGGVVGTYPGLSNAANPGNIRDVATFANANYQNVGINLNATNGPILNVGAIVVTGTNPLFVGNSSGTAGLTGRLLGLNSGIAGDNVLLSALGGDITIQPIIATGVSPMGLQLGIATGIFNAAPNRTISINTVMSEPAGLSAQLNVSGGGTVSLTGTNTFSGAITVASGTLSVNAIAGEPNLPQPLGTNIGPITFGSANAAGGFTYTGSTPAFLQRPIQVTGLGATFSSTTATNEGLVLNGLGFAISGNGAPVTFAGAGNVTLATELRGVGTTVNKIGPGTLTVAAGNTLFHTGATNITGGRFIVNGTLDGQNAPVTVGSVGPLAGTLGGAGTINRPVEIQSGGTLRGGSSPGILTINNNITMSSGSIFSLDLNGPTPGSGGLQHSQVIQATMGQLSLNGATLDIASTATETTFAPGDVIEMIKYLATNGSQFAGQADGSTVMFTSSGLPAGYVFTSTINYGTLALFPNSVTLSGISPVPEPLHILAVGAIGAAGLGWIRNRRAAKKN